MITNFSVQGFKSFGTCVSTRLQPLNFLVGANASGKTNLLSALRFVQCAINSNVEQALGEFGGKTEVWNKLQHERKEDKHLEIGFTVDSLGEFDAADKSRLAVIGATYSLKVKLLLEKGRAAIVGEHLVAQLKPAEGKVKRFHFHRNRTHLAILDESDPRFAKEERLEVPPQEMTRPVAGGVLYAVPVLLLREFVQSWAFFDFDANVGREPSREADSPLLGRHGENLATVLHEIEQHGDGTEFRAIVDGLRGVVPGFHKLSTVALPFEAKRGFQIREEKLRSPLNPHSASDGTIRILLLLVAACWSAKRAGLICIEEPENGLHPFLAEHLIATLRRASVDRQFLLTTHNPFFLDHLTPEEVLLCDKETGFTTMRHAADVEEIQGFKKHFSLGEIWMQGELGGVP